MLAEFIIDFYFNESSENMLYIHGFMFTFRQKPCHRVSGYALGNIHYHVPMVEFTSLIGTLHRFRL